MLFDKVKDILKYEPEDDEVFELLEDSNEGNENESNQQNDESLDNNHNQTEKSNKSSGNNSYPNNNKSSCGDTRVVSSNINENLAAIKSEFGVPNNIDIIVREFKIAGKVRAFIAYIDAMVDKSYVSDFVLRQLMSKHKFEDFNSYEDILSLTDYIKDNVITAYKVFKSDDLQKAIYEMLSGNSALFIDGCNECLCIASRGFDKRKIDKPVTENVVFGPQEGFTENLRTNISLIRRIIRNQSLMIETLNIGKTNQVLCAIMYLEGVTNKEIVNEVKRRIQGINADFVIGGGMLSQYIEDNSLMIFPQTLNTERPDRTASFIMEGKVAIIVEGAPFADIVPVTFYHLLQTSEDSMLRWQYGTFLRLIRSFGVFTTTLLPALYIALILFHQEAIPSELLLSIARSKEAVPFPTIVELLMLEISFELIREGGIRVPGVIGQTLGIVGALILGQAAVAARLVSPVLIIVVAVTGLGSFAIPNYSLGIGLRVIRFFFIFMASIFGFFGVSVGIFIVGCIACNMKSFGVPFLSPVAPKSTASPDLIIRQPIWKQQERPDFLKTQSRSRQGEPSREWKKKKKGGGTT